MSARVALLFPGQGSQSVGMGQALSRAFPQAKRTVDEADAILGFQLSRLMWDGPAEELKRTENAQPALLVHSVAALRALGDLAPHPLFAAGHSLGEFSAHVAAGTLDFADALRAVRLRGELMAESGARRPGAMAAVLGMTDEAVSAGCAEASNRDSVVAPANFNSDGQVVISGDADAVARASTMLKDAGARRVVPLEVSGAFHSPLMQSAVDGLRAHLESLSFSDPVFPVVSNVTAEPVTNGGEARELLVRQLTSPVRWAESVSSMVAAAVGLFIELGPGSVLCGLNRRNAKAVPCRSIGEPGEVRALREEERP